MNQDASSGYNGLAIVFHWLSAITVIGLFAVGWWMVELSYYDPWYKQGPFLHKSVGIVLALVTVLRLGWRVMSESPAPIGSKIERQGAKWVHRLLYLLLAAIFISGYLISTADGRAISVFDLLSVPALGELFANQEDIAGDLHRWLAYGLMGLVAAHALAALKHHFINRDATLVRMLKPLSNRD